MIYHSRGTRCSTAQCRCIFSSARRRAETERLRGPVERDGVEHEQGGHHHSAGREPGEPLAGQEPP